MLVLFENQRNCRETSRDDESQMTSCKDCGTKRQLRRASRRFNAIPSPCPARSFNVDKSVIAFSNLHLVVALIRYHYIRTVLRRTRSRPLAPEESGCPKTTGCCSQMYGEKEKKFLPSIDQHAMMYRFQLKSQNSGCEEGGERKKDTLDRPLRSFCSAG